MSSSAAHGEEAVIAPRRDLCLEFANTVSWRGSDAEDSLHQSADLLRWCRDNRILGGVGFAHLDDWASGTSTEATAMFAEAVALREVLYRILFALTIREAPSAADLVIFNAALRRAPLRHTVASLAQGFGWQIESDRRTAPLLLAPVLWSAADLMVGPDAGRLRHCANPKCLWLFLDDSKNGSRRWCSMRWCGNRAKAHRHYLRQRGR
jgi:predicted RNA-binding Zn ribbon-like protein